MGRLKVFYNEYGASGSLNNGKKYNVVGAEFENMDRSDYLMAANIDAISFIASYHLGLLQNSTPCWLPAHALEKYIKSFLFSLNGMTEKKLQKIGHNLAPLWKKYKEEYHFEDYPNLEEYISEISAIKTNVRYGNACVIYNDNLLSGLVFFIAHFNKFTHGSKNYHETYYGLKDIDIPEINYYSRNYLKGIIRTYLHIIIEHGITLSAAGIVHDHKYKEVQLLKQDRIEEHCPFCNILTKSDLNQSHLFKKEIIESVKKFLLHNVENAKFGV